MQSLSATGIFMLMPSLVEQKSLSLNYIWCHVSPPHSGSSRWVTLFPISHPVPPYTYLEGESLIMSHWSRLQYVCHRNQQIRNLRGFFLEHLLTIYWYTPGYLLFLYQIDFHRTEIIFRKKNIFCKLLALIHLSEKGMTHCGDSWLLITSTKIASQQTMTESSWHPVSGWIQCPLLSLFVIGG